MTHMVTINDLETRDFGTFYTGPLEEAKAFIRHHNNVSVVSRAGGMFTVFITGKSVEIPDWSNVDDYGTAPTEEDAWRYALGGAFGPANDDFSAFPLALDNAEAVKALILHHFENAQHVFFSDTTDNAMVLDESGIPWEVFPDGTLKVYRA